MPIKLVAIVFIFFSTTAIANHSLKYNITDTAKTDSIPPQFPGGIDSFNDYLKNNIRFPIISRIKGRQGKVIVRFVIDSVGTVTDVKIKKGLDSYCNKEALRVIRSSPKWTPATIKGKRVDFTYTMPLNFEDPDLVGARVMVNGNLLKNYNELKRANANMVYSGVIDPYLAKAIFGDKYNKKLIILNDTTINPKGYDEAHFKNTFDMLKNIDTGKVQLNISDKVYNLSAWRRYLNKDSVVAVFIYPNANSSFKTIDKNKSGTISLVTKTDLERQKKTRGEFLQSISAYRNGSAPLRKELLLIDGYYYNPEQVFNKIDTNIIHYVWTLSPEKAQRLYGANFKNGLIYIYTKRYQYTRPYDDKQKLLKLIEEYKQGNKAPANNIVFVNNVNIIDFERLKELPTADIEAVNIISKEEAKAFFGNSEQNGIIYITSSKFTN